MRGRWRRIPGSEGTTSRFDPSPLPLLESLVPILIGSNLIFLFLVGIQGHVDTTATIVSITPDGNSLRYLFSLPSTPLTNTLLPALTPKGYVTIDGTSLTLTSVSPSPSSSDEPSTFGVMLIAHSQEKVVLTGKKVGERVNVEADATAKMVVQAVERALSGEGGGAMGELVEKAVETILAKKGLI